MPMWLCRAGRYGEFENKFLEDNRVYCTWDNLSESIMQFPTKQDLQQYFVDNNPDVKVKTAMNWASQVWPFAHEMKKGEIVVLPSKIKPVIHFGKSRGIMNSYLTTIILIITRIKLIGLLVISHVQLLTRTSYIPLVPL